MRDKIVLTTFVALIAWGGLGGPAMAQQPVASGAQPAATATVDRAQVENYIRLIKGELERGEARVVSVTDQLRSLNGDIESRVDRIVQLLSQVRDSADTAGSRMRIAKSEVLAGLEAMARYFARERDRRKKEMNNPYAQIEAADLAGDVTALNAKIETCVTQSLEIAKSLVPHTEDDVRKYDDWDYDSSDESREYKRVKRDAEASVKIKSELVADLRASIVKLTQDVKAREMEIHTTMDLHKREHLMNDVREMRQTIEMRRAQIEELMMAPKPETRAVGQKAAFEMDQLLDEMTQSLKRDFSKLKVLINERDEARARLKPLKDKLEKATAMLAQ
jgi:hypothetical protein